MKKLQSAILSAGLALTMSSNAALLVDRGLPTQNLNNAAGANRANVAWLYPGYTATDYWLVGDSFANTSSQTWSINTIRLWSMKETETASLWGGIDGSPIGIVANSATVTDASYTSLAEPTYQGSAGSYRAMHQIDFAVNLTLAPGQVYNFFFDGRSSDSGYTLAYAHASNAALSGSPQDGSDDLMLYANIIGGSVDPLSVGTWTSLGSGWDKASDLNVQVIGTPVPEPSTYLAGALLLLPFGASTIRIMRKKLTA